MMIQTSYSLTLYENLNKELNKFTSKMKGRFNIIQNRIKEKAVGLDKISQVRKTVTDLLEKLMHDKYMPIYIRDLLLKIWFNVMVIEFLRHPPESHACQSKVKFVKMLLEAAQPNINKKIDLKYINTISMQFKVGLSLVAFNSKELDNKNIILIDFLTEIHGLEKQKDKLGQQKSEHQQSEIILFVKNRGQSAGKANNKKQIPDDFDIKTKNLRVGVWLEFKGKKSKPFRAKISWVSPITGNYLFVNSNGVRLGDKSPAEIAAVFRNKTCNELRTVALFDRALLKIAKQMNEKMGIKFKKK